MKGSSQQMRISQFGVYEGLLPTDEDLTIWSLWRAPPNRWGSHNLEFMKGSSQQMRISQFGVYEGLLPTDEDLTIWSQLTQCGPGKMAAILQMALSNAFSWMKSFDFLLKFHWNLFLSTINNKSILAQIMAWHGPGDKPLTEPMMAYLTDTYMLHSASMS